MPLQDKEGKIKTLQIIKDDGKKLMLKSGKKSGSFFILGNLRFFEQKYKKGTKSKKVYY